MKKKRQSTKQIMQAEAPGIGLEKVVAKIQQMMDLNSTVSHNEVMEDRAGNKRQYDVVIRGQFGGRPVLGVMECKDHNRKVGPTVVEAFAKKTENLGANLRVMVSKKGFTHQALKLAKFEHIGCLSLLPKDSDQVGFSIGDMWYGVISKWVDITLTVHFDADVAPIPSFSVASVKFEGKPVMNWFLKELFTKHKDWTEEGEFVIRIMFDENHEIEIEGTNYSVKGLTCIAKRIHKKKRKWVQWSGDAFYDWHTGKMSIPNKGTLVGSAVETDLLTWPDYEGEIPDAPAGGFLQVTIYDRQKWDPSKDDEVPDLGSL